MAFCSLQENNGMFVLTLSSGDGHNYLTDNAITELKDAITHVRSAATAKTRGLVTISTFGSFCDGINYGWVSAAATSEDRERVMQLMQRMTEVVRLLLDLPMPTVAAVSGDAASLGLALALAHDHCVVWTDASLELPEAKMRYRVPDYVVALVREKTAYARLRKLLVLKSQRCTGTELAKTWYSAHSALGDKDQVRADAFKLLEVVQVGDGPAYAKARQMLYPKSWGAASNLQFAGGSRVSIEDIPVLMKTKVNITEKSIAPEIHQKISAVAEVTTGQHNPVPNHDEKSATEKDERSVDEEKSKHTSERNNDPRLKQINKRNGMGSYRMLR